MTDTYHLSFSVGPVQGFVGQARRTRDLWAGSWLLSYLAESALAAAENKNGSAIIPHRPESDRGRVTAKESPVGGMPNRFELAFDGEDSKKRAIEAAQAAVNAFNRTWHKVAEAVLDKFLRHDNVLSAGNRTKDIWDRQVTNFWELSWVVGQPDTHERTIGRLAALRKNIRNVNATPEPGTKCSLMPTFQELSGHFGKASNEKQAAFWQEVRKNVDGLDLGDSERLCAIALIKRLFPKEIKAAVGPDVGAELDQVGWPSTAFIAASPWLKNLNGEARKLGEAFQNVCLNPVAGYQKSELSAARDAGIDWAVVDGPIWFASALRNDEPGREFLGIRPPGDEKQRRDQIVRSLLDQQRRLYEAAAGNSPGEQSRPVPYYALLLMDGDSIGQLLGELRTKGGPQALSKCLGEFAGTVQDIVSGHGGRTVYAGGDDVLALLPGSTALAASHELRKSYSEAFRKEGVADDVATISAAVIYAHWRYPLRQVLHTAHHLLDDVAKDKTGRDSIAIGVILGSGLNAFSSVPWTVFHGTVKTADDAPCVSLLSLVDHFESYEPDESSDPPFNASFLYLLRERFAYLLGEGHERPGEFLRFDKKNQRDTATLLRDLAHAEYRRRLGKGGRRATPDAKTQSRIDELMSLSREWQRQVTGRGTQRKVNISCDFNSFSFDGWRVARFLKQIKDGKVDDHD